MVSFPGAQPAGSRRTSQKAPYLKRQEILKIDVNPTSSLQAYYRFVNSEDEQQPPYGSWVNGGVNFELTPVLYSFPGKGHVVHLTKMLSPTFVNESNFGFSQNALLIDPVNKEAISSTRMGNLPQWYQDQASPVIDSGYMPDVTFGGQPANTVNASLQNVPWRNKNRIWIISNNLGRMAACGRSTRSSTGTGTSSSGGSPWTRLGSTAAGT